ncbi:MAG: GHKL domain-containing protein [Desulfobacteraceae bacterium]|nr:GHKL domain-containing protein [Desulfobacteraceae bacterium]
MEQNIESKHQDITSNAFQSIDLILIRETNLASLISSICDALKKFRNYKNAKIILNMDSEKESLSDDKISDLSASTLCIKQSLNNDEILLFKHKSKLCKDCTSSVCESTWASLTIKLKYVEKIYGVLFVTIQKELVSIKTEQTFLQETALNIAAGIHRITRENIFKKTAADLKKRNLELNFFYSFSKLIEKKELTLEAILKGGIDLIPFSMQHPEKACAELFLGDTNQSYKTDNYKETSLRLKNRIVVNHESIGVLTVCYSEAGKGDKNPVFLEEEQKLIHSISVRIGKIIERKRDRLALEESEKRFKDLTKNAVTGIAILQGDSIIFQNPEYKKIFGFLPDSSFFFSNQRIHSEDIDKIQEFKKIITTTDFDSQDVDFRISPAEKQENSQAMKSVFCRAIRTEFNSKEAVLLSVMDMTKPKELEHLLRIQDKMTSLGRIAAGIAHEIRNPLSGINIYLKALEKICTGREEFETEAKILSKIQSASNRIEAVIKRVLDFSKPSNLKLTNLNINIPVQNALDFASVTLRKSGVVIETKLNKKLPECALDNNMIEQVLINLLINAAEAMKTKEEGCKTIFISTYYIQDEYLCIDVEDSGIGVPKSLQDKIFDPFYTTKNSSGIGLSICKRIIKDHNGMLEVHKSDYLDGAKFIIYLPF